MSYNRRIRGDLGPDIIPIYLNDGCMGKSIRMRSVVYHRLMVYGRYKTLTDSATSVLPPVSLLGPYF